MRAYYIHANYIDDCFLMLHGMFFEDYKKSEQISWQYTIIDFRQLLEPAQRVNTPK